MRMVKWDPFPEIDDMSTRLGRMMTWPTWRAPEEKTAFFSGWAPAVDVEETDKEYLIKADLPEVKKNCPDQHGRKEKQPRLECHEAQPLPP